MPGRNSERSAAGRRPAESHEQADPAGRLASEVRRSVETSRVPLDEATEDDVARLQEEVRRLEAAGRIEEATRVYRVVARVLEQGPAGKE